ncbi:MAG: hypothetical protein COA73_04595, partial [Candidatus Hydrogenedentota bacterium]
MRLDIAAQSDIGRRKKDNEDSLGVFRDDAPKLQLFQQGALLIVADGLGGHMGGEIASKLAVSIFKDVIKEPPPESDETGEVDGPMLTLLERYVHMSNTSVFQTNEDMNTGGKPMGTTLCCGLVSPKKVHICNVGDSRVYHIRDGNILVRTEDHSWVDEQVKMGLMSKSEAEVDYRKNVVTRSIGTRAEVVVDTYTGEVKVEKVTMAQDVGRVINQMGLEAQMEGGLAFGLGFALSEEMIFEEGRLLNPNFRDYKVPTAPEMPEIEMHFIESDCEEGPYGAKGIAELPTIVVAPAIANAVYNATGIRFLNPPMNPEKVARAIWEKKQA